MMRLTEQDARSRWASITGEFSDKYVVRKNDESMLAFLKGTQRQVCFQCVDMSRNGVEDFRLVVADYPVQDPTGNDLMGLDKSRDLSSLTNAEITAAILLATGDVIFQVPVGATPSDNSLADQDFDPKEFRDVHGDIPLRDYTAFAGVDEDPKEVDPKDFKDVHPRNDTRL